MLVGRFAMIVPMVALGGFLSERKIAPQTAGTFPVTTPLFVVLLIGVILIVGALTFFPVLSLGPIVEHFLMLDGRLFCDDRQAPALPPADRAPRAVGCGLQARSAAHGAEPGHVRRAGRRRS